MVTKLSLENNTAQKISIIIEPEAIDIDLQIGKAVDVELALKTDEYNDKFTCVMEEGRLIIYECRQYEMKIFVDNNLEYYTPQGRYW
jgi:hypothetical protein